MPLDAGEDLARPGLKTRIPIAKGMQVQVWLKGVPRRGAVKKWAKNPQGLMVTLQIKKRTRPGTDLWANDTAIGKIDILWSKCMPVAKRAQPTVELQTLFPKGQDVYVRLCTNSPWKRAVVTSVYYGTERDEPYVKVQLIEESEQEATLTKEQNKSIQPKKRKKSSDDIKPVYVKTNRPLGYDYQKLGLAFGTGRKLIEEAYEQLRREYDPDKNPGNTTEAKTAKFLEIRQSYETLLRFQEGDKLYRSCFESASGRWVEFKVIEQTEDGYVLTPIDPDEGEEASRCVTKTEAHSNYLPDDDDV